MARENRQEQGSERDRSHSVWSDLSSGRLRRQTHTSLYPLKKRKKRKPQKAYISLERKRKSASCREQSGNLRQAKCKQNQTLVLHRTLWKEGGISINHYYICFGIITSLQLFLPVIASLLTFLIYFPRSIPFTFSIPRVLSKVSRKMGLIGVHITVVWHTRGRMRVIHSMFSSDDLPVSKLSIRPVITISNEDERDSFHLEKDQKAEPE